MRVFDGPSARKHTQQPVTRSKVELISFIILIAYSNVRQCSRLLGNALLLGKVRQPESHDNAVANCYLSYSLPVHTHPQKTWLYYLSFLTDVCSVLHFQTHSHTIITVVSWCRDSYSKRSFKWFSSGLCTMHCKLYLSCHVITNWLLATPPHTTDHHNTYSQWHVILLFIMHVRCSTLSSASARTSQGNKLWLVHTKDTVYRERKWCVFRDCYRYICRSILRCSIIGLYNFRENQRYTSILSCFFSLSSYVAEDTFTLIQTVCSASARTSHRTMTMTIT
jgi:hypothetical protein